MTAVSAVSTLAAQSFSRSPLPARGVTKTTWRARPRRGGDTPSSALAAGGGGPPGGGFKFVSGFWRGAVFFLARPENIGGAPLRSTPNARFSGGAAPPLV